MIKVKMIQNSRKWPWFKKLKVADKGQKMEIGRNHSLSSFGSIVLRMRSCPEEMVESDPA